MRCPCCSIELSGTFSEKIVRDIIGTYERERKQRLRMNVRDKQNQGIYLTTLTKKVSKKDTLEKLSGTLQKNGLSEEAFPKRKGSNPKHPARAKFFRAVKSGVDPELIISGAGRYAEDPQTGTEFICMASTWLNQRRWEDYPPAEITILTPERRAEILAKIKRAG